VQLALLTHAKILDLLPPEKRASEFLAAVQCVATSLRSIDEIEGVPWLCWLVGPSTKKRCCPRVQTLVASDA
jgi:hypothetical protein